MKISRRQFLKGLGAAILLPVKPPEIIPHVPPPIMDNLGIWILLSDTGIYTTENLESPNWRYSNEPL